MVNINVQISYKENDLRDILGTALEGGIGYWSEAENVKRTKHAPGEDWWYTDCDLRDMLEHEGEDPDTYDPLHLDVEVIKKGLIALANKDIPVNQRIVEAICSGDTGNIDSEVADCIVQAGLFGEVRYG